jgi:hypothetical protein
LETSTSASSSSASGIEDIIRQIAPSDRPGFHETLQHELGGRELPSDEIRRVPERTWHASALASGPLTA